MAKNDTSNLNTTEPILVNVVDPTTKAIWSAELCEDSDGFFLKRSSDQKKNAELFLSPGWIDLHAHVYQGVGHIPISPDYIGLNTGVHLIADAGSAGEATIEGFKKYVAPSFNTPVKAWLNISSLGLAQIPEASDIALMDVVKTIKAAKANPEFVCGIKIRAEQGTVGALGIQPVKLAAKAAREAGMRLMVHIGLPMPCIEDILDVMASGDVLSHIYHGKINSPWYPDGKPIPAMKRALDRGVLMDVAHGLASFSFDVAKKAIAAGYPPFTISTDAHILNLNGPVYDLPTTMTKMCAIGMSLIDVIEAVTVAPAKILQQDGWCDLNGRLRNATIFRVSTSCPDWRKYKDMMGKEISPEKHIIPEALITKEGMKWLDYSNRNVGGALDTSGGMHI